MKPQNPHENCDFMTTGTHHCKFAWQEGWDTLRKWLFEPCTEHLIAVSKCKYDATGNYQYWDELEPPGLRYQCPKCMKGLEV